LHAMQALSQLSYTPFDSTLSIAAFRRASLVLRHRL
jgi:hypothetical protein